MRSYRVLSRSKPGYQGMPDAHVNVGLIATKQIELAEAVKSVNYAIDSGSHGSLIAALKNPVLGLKIIDAAHDLYKSEFAFCRSSKKTPLSYSNIRSLALFLFNIIRISIESDNETESEFWEKITVANLHLEDLHPRHVNVYRKAIRDEVRRLHNILKHDQIQTIIDGVNRSYVIRTVVQLQARARGFIMRRQLSEMQMRQRQLVSSPPSATTPKEVNFEESFTSESDLDYEVLLQGMLESKSPPSIPSLRKLLHLLDISEQDFSLELEMQKLKEKAVSLTRFNRQLAIKIDEADRRIGSLVRNCQIASSKTSLELMKEQNLDVTKARRKGINEFTKEGRQRLAAYQNLFYCLQTQPQYLARLIVLVNTGKISRIRKTCLYTLFAYSSAPREAFFLSKVLKAALDLEVQHNVNSIADVSKSEPIVITLALDYFRDECMGSLCSSLQPLIMQVIEKRRLISVDPIVVYRQWIGELETTTGKTSGLPYNVSLEEALSHDEVKDRINDNIQMLLNLANEFIEVISSEGFVEEIPYGLRRISRYLWEALAAKIPSTPTKELLKVTAHVLLYRFIIPVICSPDAYNLVTPGQVIRVEARSNLAAICKLLQAAATGKTNYNFGSGLESTGFYQGLSVVVFLQSGYERFKDFFRQAFQVPEPEDHFDVNEFSDESLLMAPQLQIALKDIFELHHWLYEYRDQLAPEASDHFNTLLTNCGPPPKTIKDLIHPRSDASSPGSGIVIGEELSLTVVTLTLTSSESIVKSSDLTSKTSIRVKQAIVELIKHREHCSDLNEVFFKSITESESRSYDVTRQIKSEQLSEEVKAQSILFSPMGNKLKTLLEFVRLNFKAFACRDWNSITRTLLEDIASKVANRERRQYELEKMKSTVMQLKAKKEFSEKTLAYYKEYIAQVLTRFSATQTSKKGSRTPAKSKKQSIQYTAKELKEKGILISIVDVPESQFKHVMFEIKSKDAGLFTITTKYHGLEVDKQDIEFQFLLHLQFEGIAVYNLMDKAKINVNLLVYLINKKFYSKIKT